MRWTVCVAAYGALLLSVACPPTASAGGNYYARIRANDAPIGGRFTIYAYMLDSLDAAVEADEPGRFLAIHFRDANGKDSFVIPGDLNVTDPRRRVWRRGFTPLTQGRLAGHLGKDQSRWALWWIPQSRDSLVWSAPADLEVHYGYAKSTFVPLEDKDAVALQVQIPWAALAGLELEEERAAAELWRPPDAGTFEVPPKILHQRAPEYPKTARMYTEEGRVFVVANIDEAGKVTDACVLESTAPHVLNVSALSAIMDWRFKPAKKNGMPVACEIVVPVSFSMGGEE